MGLAHMLDIKGGGVGVHQWNIQLKSLPKHLYVRYHMLMVKLKVLIKSPAIAADTSRRNCLLCCSLYYQTCHLA